MTDARQRTRPRKQEAGGLWHQPALMNLVADVLLVLASAGLVWAALLAVQRMPFFPLREIVLLERPQRVSLEQLAHVARTGIHGNFFTVDLAAARHALLQLPWVRDVRLRRQWPAGLELAIEEHVPIARWRQPNGELAFVNDHGELFVADDGDEFATLPLFAGPPSAVGEIRARHDEFSRRLAPLGRQLAAITLSPRGAWRLRLDDGLVIELGRDDERHPPLERLDRFVAHYEAVKGRLGELRVADMRYPNGFALVVAQRPPRVERKTAEQTS